MAALVGRGGSGKSHCAKTFARKWSDQDSRRWAYWLNAETETELRQSYTQLLTLLGSALPTEDLGTAEIARRVWDQLKVNQFEYLLVFDNAPEGDESGREGPDALHPLFPPIERDHWSRGRICSRRDPNYSAEPPLSEILRKWTWDPLAPMQQCKCYSRMTKILQPPGRQPRNSLSGLSFFR